MGKATTAERELTEKQRAWLLHFLGDCHGNLVKACREAGYKGDTNVLTTVAHANLQNPTVQRAIEEHFRPLGVTADRTIREIAIHAFNNNLADFHDWFTGDKTLPELRDEGIPTQVVQKAKVTVRTDKDGNTEEVRELALRPVQPSLEKLMKALRIGESTEDTTVQVPQVTYNFVKKIELRLERAGSVRYHPELPPFGEGDDGAGRFIDADGMDSQPVEDSEQTGAACPVEPEPCSGDPVPGDEGAEG